MPHVRFNLIALPQAYDTLYSDLVSRSRCPTTGKAIKDPALCLRCSAVLCAGGKCCRRRDIGPVCQHVYACSGDSGAVMLLNIAQVLLVRGPFGVVMDAPYVDAHGEHDPGMRRGRPLQLEPRQLEALRRLCLGHGLGPTVSRMRNSAETVIYCSYY
jgi:E3 ubiquitin-protein ligase UBR1